MILVPLFVKGNTNFDFQSTISDANITIIKYCMRVPNIHLCLNIPLEMGVNE